MKNKLKSALLTLPFAIIAFPLCMININAHMYSFVQIFSSCAFLIIGALILYASTNLISNLKSKKNRHGQTLAYLILSIFLSGFFFLSFASPINILLNHNQILKYLTLIFTICGLFVSFKYFEVYWLNAFLITLLAIQIPLFIFSESKSELESIGTELEEHNLLEEYEDREDFNGGNLKLASTPNIYLFWQESYSDLDIMQKVYGINPDSLRDYLASKQFFEYRNTYSNSDYTLASMYNLFRFSIKLKTVGNFDVARATRYTLGGGNDNILLKTLKRNGYYNSFLTYGSPYYIHDKGELLDYTDAPVYPSLEYILAPIMNFGGHQMQKITYKITHLILNALGDEQLPSVAGYSFTIETLQELRNKAHSQGKPLFVSFKIGARHTPGDGSYGWRNSEEWIKSGEYQKAVKEGNSYIKDIVDHLTSIDPNAIIILLGDHGPNRLRSIEKDVETRSMADLSYFLETQGESLQSFADDRTHVFLAIRTGEKLVDISNGLVMSPVNLFYHIFAYLNSDTQILSNRPPSVTYLPWDDILVKDGKVQNY